MCRIANCKGLPGTGRYVHGTEETGIWEMYVRDWDRGVSTQVNPIGALLERAGLVHETQIGAARVTGMPARHTHDYATDVVRRQPDWFHQIGTPEEAKA